MLGGFDLLLITFSFLRCTGPLGKEFGLVSPCAPARKAAAPPAPAAPSVPPPPVPMSYLLSEDCVGCSDGDFISVCFGMLCFQSA